MRIARHITRRPQLRVRLSLVAQLGVKLRQQQVRIDVVGNDVKGLYRPLDRDVKKRACFRLPTLPVVDAHRLQVPVWSRAGGPARTR